MSLFITFEGGEGSGKSSQARALYRRLKRQNIPALLTYEPGGTALGRRIARWLKWSDDMDITPAAELLLFNASRAQLVAEVIRPALEGGQTVICDRYAGSTIAYQGYGRGLELALVRAVNDAATAGLKPDVTFLLDIDAQAGLGRKGGRADRFEQQAREFHRRVREGYLELAKAEPERWRVIDAEKSKEEIADIIWQRVSHLLPR